MILNKDVRFSNEACAFQEDVTEKMGEILIKIGTYYADCMNVLE